MERMGLKRRLMALDAIVTGSLLITLAAWAAPASAQTPDTAAAAAASTWSQALDAAWARHPQAQALAARRDEAQARADRASGLIAGPSSVSVNYLTDQPNRNVGRREWEVEWTMPLWLPGQKTARVNEADRMAAEVATQAEVLRLQLAGQLREAWWSVAAARHAQALSGQRFATAQELERQVQRRFKSGEVARVDANLARSERLSAEADVLDAQAALQQASQAYAALTGTPPPASLPPERDASADDQIDHPQLRTLQAAADVAASRVALVDASRRDAPELAVRWVNQRDQIGIPYDQAVGVKLTLPLSSDARARQDGSAARAELAQAEAELALARARIAQDAQQARAELNAANRQFDLARERQALTEDNLHLAQKAFELGESDLPTLLRARAAEHEAQASLKKQEVARAAALSHLHQAQGVLP